MVLRKKTFIYYLSKKSNLIWASATHFGTKGLYYSYGKNGNYGRFNNSFDEQYVNRKYKDRMKNNPSNTNAEIMIVPKII